MPIQFVVENAGCASCGELVREALGSLGAVEAVDVDEAADVATVRLECATTVSVEDVDRVLDAASGGSGHSYCVQPGSWTTPGAR